MQLQAIVSILAAVATVNATPLALNSRAVIAHDAVVPIAESVPNTAVGNAVRKFEPYLHIAHGCQVYTAVNANGDTRYVMIMDH